MVPTNHPTPAASTPGAGRRRRVAAALVVVATIASLLAQFAPAVRVAAATRFADTDPGAFYGAALEWATTAGVTSGVGGSDRFEPHRAVTRAEVVAMVWRAAGQPPVAAPHPYGDVADGHFADGALRWSSSVGLTSPAVQFRPEAPSTRAETVTMLWRAAGSPTSTGPLAVDVSPGHFAATAVRWAWQTRVSTGVGGSNRFEPDRPVTRAETVTFLWRSRPVTTLPPGPMPTTPTTTTPSTTSTTVPAGPGGAATVPSNFDVNQYLMAPWDTPSDMSWQPSGNFRTFCEFSHLAYADPIVAPGNGAFSHLHMFFGNTGTNASSTYQSLRSSGNSTCDGGPLNRTAYWMPAVFDASGNVVTPSNFELYYKAENTSAGTLAQKHAEIRGVQDYPNGLRMIAGSPNRSVSGWKCSNGAEGTTIPDCPVGQRLTAWVRFPYCWDGRNLDSADHRSHMAYGTNNTWGGCPASHPIHLPELTEFAHFDVGQAGTSQWYLSSDRMAGAAVQPNGSTFHADWFGAWDNTIQNRWISNCIRGMRNSSNGNLCDGQQMRPPANYNGPNRIAGYTPSPR